jgi:hypothetical protein
VTYVGCVKAGTTPGTFILESAELSPAAGAGAAGAAAGAAASPSAAVGTSGNTKMTFNLTPKAGTDLSAHANHKMEFVGTLAPAAPAASATASGAGAGATATASTSTRPTQTLTIDSFKMVSTTCQ